MLGELKSEFVESPPIKISSLTGEGVAGKNRQCMVP